MKGRCYCWRNGDKTCKVCVARAARPVLTAADIKVNHVYSAKDPSSTGLFSALWNDRMVLWIDALGAQVQYDSPAVRTGGKYPKVTMERFLKWADRDVTAEMPNSNEWRSAYGK